MQDATDFEAPSQEDVRADLLGLFRGAIRMTLESMLEEEIRAMVGGARWAWLGRKDHRNGSYLRGLLTSMGQVEVAVPRSRTSGSAGAEVLCRYKRRAEEIDAAITEDRPSV